MNSKRIIEQQAFWMAEDWKSLREIKKLAKQCEVRLPARLKIKLAAKVANDMGIY
ncbi:hypothetical protein ACLEVB_17265 [Enterobacter ludwigii]|uniref:hypothetical protein n=1 Tax=Enterobacter ludwigii TaxID=299767 RepID=UPI0039768D76